MNNSFKLYIRDSLFETAQMFAAGAALTQTYLSSIGLPERMIGTAVSAMGIVNVVTSVLFSKLSDRSRHIKKSISALFLIIAATYLCFPALQYRPGLPAGVLFLVVAAAGFAQSAAAAFRNLFEYKLPFLIFDMNKYSRFLTLDGVIAGLFSVLFSILLNILLSRADYFMVIRAGFLFACALTCFAAFVNRQFDDKNPDELKPNKTRPPVKISLIIKRRDFTAFAIPNFLRGISAGVVNMAALIALNSSILDSKGTSYIVTATTIGNIAGSLIYTVLTKRVEDKHMCLLGSALMLPLVFMSKTGPTAYILLFFFANLGIRIISYAYPLMIYKLIPFEIIGTYNTLRMMLTTAGTAAATYLTGRLLGNMPVQTFFLAAVACQILSAAAYLRIYPKFLAAKSPEKTAG